MRRPKTVRALILVASAVIAGAAGGQVSSAMAQEDWKPFSQPEPRRPARSQAQQPSEASGSRESNPSLQPAPPPSAYAPPPWETRGRANEPATGLPSPLPAAADRAAIERSELPPVPGTTALPAPSAQTASPQALPELWRGLDPASFEQLLAALQLPPRSHALHQLWRRMITSDPGGRPADEDARRFLALRAEALRRSGLVAEEAKLLEAASGDGVFLTALAARAKVGAGDRDGGCELTKAALAQRSALPGPLRAELMLASGYCAGVARNPSAVQLAADLMREENVEAAFGLALLDAIGAGVKPRITPGKQVSAIEYRLLELAGGGFDAAQIVERAGPAVLAAMAGSSESEPKLRVLAAEASARLNIVSADQLGEAWRGAPFSAADIADPGAAKVETVLRRAFLFRAAESERTPAKKTRLIRALLDDSRRSGFYVPALLLVARQVEALAPAPETSWFAETAVETLLAAGAFDRARQWIELDRAGSSPAATGGLQHWLALADIADPRMSGPRGASLASVEALALRGRFAPDQLHRLATVLDALDYNVPIPLWEAASRAPQPTAGYLPPTGVLSQLQDAAKRGEQGRTALLAMQALGPSGGEGAHMIALGDAIRALKRARLEPDARRLAFEALLAGWPRAGVN